MSSRKQREKNRVTAERLRLESHTCENCGQRGGHWVAVPQTLAEILRFGEQQGFYTCPSLYDENGKRAST